jgi:hypothetical protein
LSGQRFCFSVAVAESPTGIRVERQSHSLADLDRSLHFDQQVDALGASERKKASRRSQHATHRAAHGQ